MSPRAGIELLFGFGFGFAEFLEVKGVSDSGIVAATVEIVVGEDEDDGTRVNATIDGIEYSYR